MHSNLPVIHPLVRPLSQALGGPHQKKTREADLSPLSGQHPTGKVVADSGSMLSPLEQDAFPIGEGIETESPLTLSDLSVLSDESAEGGASLVEERSGLNQFVSRYILGYTDRDLAFSDIARAVESNPSVDLELLTRQMAEQYIYSKQTGKPEEAIVQIYLLANQFAGQASTLGNDKRIEVIQYLLQTLTDKKDSDEAFKAFSGQANDIEILDLYEDRHASNSSYYGFKSFFTLSGGATLVALGLTGVFPPLLPIVGPITVGRVLCFSTARRSYMARMHEGKMIQQLQEIKSNKDIKVEISS